MGGANKLRVTAVDSVVPVLGSGVDITGKQKDELHLSAYLSLKRISILK